MGNPSPSYICIVLRCCLIGKEKKPVPLPVSTYCIQTIELTYGAHTITIVFVTLHNLKSESEKCCVYEKKRSLVQHWTRSCITEEMLCLNEKKCCVMHLNAILNEWKEMLCLNEKKCCVVFCRLPAQVRLYCNRTTSPSCRHDRLLIDSHSTIRLS